MFDFDFGAPLPVDGRSRGVLLRVPFKPGDLLVSEGARTPDPKIMVVKVYCGLGVDPFAFATDISRIQAARAIWSRYKFLDPDRNSQPSSARLVTRKRLEAWDLINPVEHEANRIDLSNSLTVTAYNLGPASEVTDRRFYWVDVPTEDGLPRCIAAACDQYITCKPAELKDHCKILAYAVKAKDIKVKYRKLLAEAH